MCVLGNLNAIPFDKSAKAQWGLPKFDVWGPKSKIPSHYAK